MRRLSVVVRLQWEGIHYWKEANTIPSVSFLRHKHRHTFFIECRKEVSHENREIEIIAFKSSIRAYLFERFPDGDMKDMSCEALARLLTDVFSLNYCSVLEDNENGAIITTT